MASFDLHQYIGELFVRAVVRSLWRHPLLLGLLKAPDETIPPKQGHKPATRQTTQNRKRQILRFHELKEITDNGIRVHRGLAVSLH